MLLRSAVGMAAPQATVPALGAAELVGAALEAFADRLGPAGGRAQQDQAASCRRRAASRPAGGSAGSGGVGRRRTDRHRRRRHTSRCSVTAAPIRRCCAETSPRITLTRSHRCAPVIADAITAVARRLPGADAARDVSGAEERPGSLTVRIAATPHAESALIADALRRAHLVDGVPWSQMAVIVRSVPRLGAALARALVSAGCRWTPPVERSAGRSASREGAADGARRDGATV